MRGRASYWAAGALSLCELCAAHPVLTPPYRENCSTCGFHRQRTPATAPARHFPESGALVLQGPAQQWSRVLACVEAAVFCSVSFIPGVRRKFCCEIEVLLFWWGPGYWQRDCRRVEGVPTGTKPNLGVFVGGLYSVERLTRGRVDCSTGPWFVEAEGLVRDWVLYWNLVWSKRGRIGKWLSGWIIGA